MDDRELPEYLCHKKVRALKIGAIEFKAANGEGWIKPMDAGYGWFSTDPGYNERFKGDEQRPPDLGYYVVYEGGYESWSPTKAFEDGYTLVK